MSYFTNENGKIFDRIIITAASKAYASSLAALLGSINLNWPNHPPVLVYDIGLDERTLETLIKHNILVRKVPHFCLHWRKHFTWKIWCWNDAPANHILWLDAGLVILRPCDEIFYAIKKIGYFVVPSYHLLTENASLDACMGCGVSPDFRKGRMTLAGCIIGFDKTISCVVAILKEAFSVALREKCIAATEPLHRHDQSIISLLMHKNLNPLIQADGIVYSGWQSPQQTPGQKIWVHRRSLSREDIYHFQTYISNQGDPYIPSAPEKEKVGNVYKILRWLKLELKRLLKYKVRSTWRIYDGMRD